MMMTMMVPDTKCMGRVYILVRVTDADLGGGGVREQVQGFGPVVLALEGHCPLCPEESDRFPDVLGYLGDVVAVLLIVCATVNQPSAQPGEGTREREVEEGYGSEVGPQLSSWRFVMYVLCVRTLLRAPCRCWMEDAGT
jgi:hypothetical protein